MEIKILFSNILQLSHDLHITFYGNIFRNIIVLREDALCLDTTFKSLPIMWLQKRILDVQLYEIGCLVCIPELI